MRVDNFVTQSLGHRWEGLYGWVPVLKAVDELMQFPPAGELPEVRSSAGKLLYPKPADVISTSELLAFAMPHELSHARPIWIGPSQLEALPEWRDAPLQRDTFMFLSPQAHAYAETLQLPFDRVFLDFTDAAGNPACLKTLLRYAKGRVHAYLYGALVMRVNYSEYETHGERPVFADGSLVVVPFGTQLRLEEEDTERRAFHSVNPPLRVPPEASIGYIQFGGESVTSSAKVFDRPRVLLGDAHMAGQEDIGPRPMLGLMHSCPIVSSGECSVIATVGLGAQTADCIRQWPDLRMGVWDIPEGSQIENDALSQSAVVCYQAEQALKTLYLLESVNVSLEPVTVSRQVRRAVSRSEDRDIALTVSIATRHRRSSARRTRGEKGTANYSHSFDRIGHYNHVTRGSHVRNPDVMKPCVDWQAKHPHSESCRREWIPAVVVDAGEDKPYVPKSRELRKDEAA